MDASKKKIMLSSVNGDASGPEQVAAGKKVAAPLLLYPKVVVYGNKLCPCCTKLRQRLEMAGWRYMWKEVKLGKKLQKIVGFPQWKGCLPVIKVNGSFLEVVEDSAGTLNFEPWNILDPKKSVLMHV